MKKIVFAAACALAVLMFSVIAYAQPVAVDAIDAETPERKPTSSGGIGVNSYSGNTTQLDVNGTQITGHWQGYYGNISGEITLDDGDSNTLFAWTLASASGEIYAANTSATVHWGNITCINLTNGTGDSENLTAASKINATTLDQQYYISQADEDRFSATFSGFYSGSFSVGGVTIDSADACPRAYMYVSNATQSTDYQEVLLFDNLSALVFTTIIEPDTTVGFDGNEWNFEMLVAQQNASAGTYYFYVELS